MLWLALHFSRLPVEVFTTGQHHKQQPFVVLQENRVSFLNPAAVDCGIVPGATLATAHSIQPALKYRQRDTTLELERLHMLGDILYRFSGYVSIQAPDNVLLEIGGSLKLFQTAERLTLEAVRVCRALGHRATAGVSTTPWAAIALARSESPALADVPLVDAGLEMAGVKNTVIERLANMGIYTLGGLLNLPARSVGTRFGKPLLQYLSQLRGELADPRQALQPAQGFQRDLHLLSPLRGKQELSGDPRSPMNRLGHELQHWLVAHQLGCEDVVWNFLSHTAHQQISMTVHFAKGKQSAADILRISDLKLMQIDLPEEVLSVNLQAIHTRPWIGSSSTLFQLAGEQPDSAGNIIDEFNARLGVGVCRRIQTLDQHTPEATWQAPAARSLEKIQSSISGKASVESTFLYRLKRRPLWLFDPPRQVHLAELELRQGPERIQSQWWQGDLVSRDYYIAQHRTGAECWAFVDHKAQWYLHGYFG